MKKPDIYTNLKTAIENEKAYWDNDKYKRHNNENNEERENKKAEVTVKKEEEKTKIKGLQKFEYNLVLNEDFTSKLGLSELYRLSELQLELEKCTTQFGVIYTIGTSPFYENLSPERYSELEQDNQRLFEMIKLEDLKKMKSAES